MASWSPAPSCVAGLLPEPPRVLVLSGFGMVLSPPGRPLVPAVLVRSPVVPVLAAALAALDADGGEVAPSQHPQGLAEAERQAVTLTNEARLGAFAVLQVALLSALRPWLVVTEAAVLLRLPSLCVNALHLAPLDAPSTGH